MWSQYFVIHHALLRAANLDGQPNALLYAEVEEHTRNSRVKCLEADALVLGVVLYVGQLCCLSKVGIDGEAIRAVAQVAFHSLDFVVHWVILGRNVEHEHLGCIEFENVDVLAQTFRQRDRTVSLVGNDIQGTTKNKIVYA